MWGLGLKRVDATLPSVPYHPLWPFHFHTCWVVEKRDYQPGILVSPLWISVFQSERISNNLLPLLMLNLEWPPHQLRVFPFFYCPSSNATSSRKSFWPLAASALLIWSYRLWDWYWEEALHFCISFSLLESNVIEDKNHNSSFSVTLTTWPYLVTLLMVPCCL